MNVSLLPYVITLFLTGLLAFGVMIVALRRSAVAGARSIAILMGALTIWSIAYGFEIGSTSLAWKYFWIKVQYFGIVIVPVAWFCFAFQYNGRGKWINSRTVLYLLIEPVLMLLLVGTNEIHGWVWGDVTLVPSQAGEILILTHNFAFYLNLIYAYFLTVIGSLSIVRKYLESPPLFKRQMSLILIAALFPFSANILYISGFRPFLFLDLTPFGFAFAGIAATWGLMRFKLLDVIPVARHTLLDVMDEGVIVIDAHERIVDINRSGLQMLNLEVGEVIGRYAGDVLQVWDRLKSVAGDTWMRSSFDEEISLDKTDGCSSHYVRVRPLGGVQDPIAGCMLLWSDITARKRMEDALRHSEEIHSQSLMRSPNPIFSVDRRGHIQFWNPACE
ncbi:MAG: histidine kinase N-terminal 7TM domain-containing protein, partial [Anaerolineales bacterium]